MADNLLTKCPHCGTTFRLTQAQLDIAGGAVRCGACYQVFHAAEHIVKTSVVEERRTVTKSPDPVEEAFDMKTDEGMDPYDSDDLNLDEPSEEVFSEEYRAGLDKESTLEEFGYQEPKPKKKDKSDESWAEELLKELGEDEAEELVHEDEEEDKPAKIVSGDHAFSMDDEPAAKKKKPRRGNELSDTFTSLGNFSSEDPFAISDIEDEEFGGEPASDDESWAKAMLDELEEEETPKKAAPAGLALQSEEQPEEDKSPFAARELSKDKREIIERAKQDKAKQKSLSKNIKKSKDTLRNDETEDFFNLLEEDRPPAQTAKQTKRVEPELHDHDELEDIDDEAITPENLFADSDEVINQQIRLSALEYGREENRSAPRNGLWAGLMVLLLLTLAGQYAYFNFDSLSRISTVRPYIEQYCPMLGCEPAPQSDVASIVGTNLVVRSHPFEKNALVIDVIIKNQAQFDQPYPVVQLNFEDINGEPVASRRFAPAEYISDKTIALDNMPSDTPIHLTLEIEDPGREAVNYELLFLPHTSAS
ncbi:MAG: DUF3426 domain-containing protein [Pseudomonadota bacterium]|nr:DUF3426 domain-containing protein [Pseudomonadota bacterium]